MQSARRRSPPHIFYTVLFIAFLCLFPALALASASASQRAVAPEDELICHTSDPSECYPRIFRPTDEFQIVHEDQEIPKGLHVRLNMSTGKREAKINVEGEVPPELQGFEQGGEEGQAVLVVEPEASDEVRIPDGAPEYEPVGKIKEPENEATHFYDALKIVKEGGEKHGGSSVDDALESLEDISHDIYYGLKITEDSEALKALLCLMAGRYTHDGKATAPPQDQQAAAVLAGALSNNPTALKEVTGSWKLLMEDTCPNGGDVPLGRDFFQASPIPDGDNAAQAKESAAKAKAKVAAINGLIKSDAIREDFLASDGMAQLVELLIPEGKEWAGAQRKVGQLALDNFLDEDMGATLGQWPKKVRAGDEQCKKTGVPAEEGCWDYHVERIMKANKKDKEHWSRDLHNRLAASRKSFKEAPPHNEL